VRLLSLCRARSPSPASRICRQPGVWICRWLEEALWFTPPVQDPEWPDLATRLDLPPGRSKSDSLRQCTCDRYNAGLLQHHSHPSGCCRLDTSLEPFIESAGVSNHIMPPFLSEPLPRARE